jgi:hypothetical protein
LLRAGGQQRPETPAAEAEIRRLIDAVRLRGDTGVWVRDSETGHHTGTVWPLPLASTQTVAKLHKAGDIVCIDLRALRALSHHEKGAADFSHSAYQIRALGNSPWRSVTKRKCSEMTQKQPIWARSEQQMRPDRPVSRTKLTVAGRLESTHRYPDRAFWTESFLLTKAGAIGRAAERFSRNSA